MTNNRSNRNNRKPGDTVKFSRRTLFASATVVQLVCTFCTFVELCKKQKSRGAARVFTFFGCLSALTGLAILCSEKNRNRPDEDSDTDAFDGRGGTDDSPTFFSSARFSRARKSVRELFTDASAFSRNGSDTKNSKKAGTNPTDVPSNVTVIIPETPQSAPKSDAALRAEHEKAEREKAAELAREAEQKEARARLDEAIRILKTAAEGTPTDESECGLEDELSSADTSPEASGSNVSETLQDGEIE